MNAIHFGGTPCILRGGSVSLLGSSVANGGKQSETLFWDDVVDKYCFSTNCVITSSSIS